MLLYTCTTIMQHLSAIDNLGLSKVYIFNILLNSASFAVLLTHILKLWKMSAGHYFSTRPLQSDLSSGS